MKCAFDHCLKTARSGLFGSVDLGRTKITFQVCMAHWKVVGRLQEKFEKENVVVSPKAGQTVGAAPAKYSVEELEKIVRGNEKNEELLYVKDGVIYYIGQSAEYLIKTLKQDKKLVEEILNGKP